MALSFEKMCNTDNHGYWDSNAIMLLLKSSWTTQSERIEQTQVRIKISSKYCEKKTYL